MVLDTALAELSDVDRTFLVKDGHRRRALTDVQHCRKMGKSIRFVGVYRRRLLDTGIFRAAGRAYVEFTLPYLTEHLRDHAVQLHNPGQQS